MHDAGEELVSAWAEEVNDILTPTPLNRFLALAWTPADVRRLAELARHVRATGSAYVTMTSTSGLTPLKYMALDFAMITAGVIERGVPADVAFGWIEVYAYCPEQLALDDLIGMGSTYQGPNSLPVPEWSHALGEFAPLAWAAGLTLAEATARQADAGLVREDLFLLATLRGYRLLPR